MLASSIVSDVDVPGFDRATMDGYAVAADATEGATPYNRVPLAVVGDAMPGSPFTKPCPPGTAVRIMTGAPMPAGCDSVLPAEFVEAEPGSSTQVMAVATMSPGKNVGRRGEDIVRGAALFDAGRVLRPQDLGVISSIGCATATVIRKPRVRLVITGNELLPAGSAPRDFRITDANGPMLAALAARDGAIVDFPGLVPDEPRAILEAMRADADVVIVSGGSSVGIEDHAPMLLAEHGTLAVHGIAMRPSSPTGFGRLGDALVFLLPGNPVSALCAYDFFAGRAIRALGGRPQDLAVRPGSRHADPQDQLADRAPGLRSRAARSTARWSRCRSPARRVLSSTTRADGFVIVDDDSEGFPAGADVDVWLYG